MKHELKITERTAWMIERRADADPAIKSPGPHWLKAVGHDKVGPGGRPNLLFTSDPHLALQFSRQVDAQGLLDWFGQALVEQRHDRLLGISNRMCYVTEHIFEEADNAR